MSYSIPILLLTYNSAIETEIALKNIVKLKPNNLFVSNDGPKNELDKEQVHGVRKIINCYEKNGYIKSKNYLNSNFGIKNGVINGITWFFKHNKFGIILEDDVIPKLEFFYYIKDYVHLLLNDANVSMMTGYNYNHHKSKNIIYYSHFGSIWGWATTSNHWEAFLKTIPDFDKKTLNETLTSIDVSKYHRKKMISEIERTKIGIIQSWAYLWEYYRYINQTLAVSFNKNLIDNIGLGNQRTHYSQFDTKKPRTDLVVDFDQVIISNNNYDKLYLNKKYKITINLRTIRIKIGKILKIINIKNIKKYIYMITHNSFHIVKPFMHNDFMLVSYILPDNLNKPGHQNRYEPHLIIETCKKVNLNVIFYRFDRNVKLNKNINVKIVFGIEPNFELLAKAYPMAVKIYYATGSHQVFQNNEVIKRTDYFNSKYAYNLPYSRLQTPHNSLNHCDKILLIGTDYTAKTFPSQLQKKIGFIKQPILPLFKDDIKIDFKKNKKNFIFFAGNGNILKGLDLVIEVFKNNGHLNLYIVTEIEEKLVDKYNDLFQSDNNIINIGYLKNNDPKLKDIVSKSCFSILPSCSEGIPGSVRQLMLYGIIPIVSKSGMIENESTTNKLGFLIDDLNEKSVENSVFLACIASLEELENKSSLCTKYIQDVHTVDNYIDSLKNIIIEEIN